MSIPNRLRDKSISFCLVEKPVQNERSSGKKPFQANWPKLNIKWDNESLNKWLDMNGNYGVIGGGEKNLVVIDFDDKVLQDELESKLPETFTVKTGGGLLHKYYFTDGGKSFKILDDEGNTRADIQADGKQVVGPGSKHYTGNMYQIEKNLPIATMKYDDIKDMLIPFNTFKKNKSVTSTPIKNIAPQQKTIFSGDDNFQEDLFSSVSFKSLLSEFGVDTSQNPTNCPFHESKGGKCLGFEEEQAHCFHCEGAWNKMSWIKANKNCEAKEAITWLAEREGRTEELEASREKWKDDKVREEVQEMLKTVHGGKEGQPEEFKENEITWTDEKLPWEDIKEDIRKIIKGTNKMFLVFNHCDKIKGKPQLIHTTKKKIALVREVEKEKGKGEDKEIVSKIKFLDEATDRRSDGITINEWAKDFWLYRVVSDNVEYYLFSEKEMPLQGCVINGMKMELNDMAEMNQSLKVKCISTAFFVHSFEPSVKIISKKEVVEMTKKKKITEEVWTDFLDEHPLATRNRFPHMSNMLRSSQILSGKKHDWPLHVGVIGPAGTRKSMGYVETIAHKFEEDCVIIEGGNSRIKGLSPSFKEKPANIGYLAKAERMGFIDELGKMIEFESNKHDGQVNNVLGELNFLLDHKRRTVGSGNDNDCVVKANAKFLFVSNPVRKKRYLKDHVGTVDPTTMSRILWWIQNKAEQDFVIGPKGVEEIESISLTVKKDGKKEVKDIECSKDIEKIKSSKISDFYESNLEGVGGTKDIQNKVKDIGVDVKDLSVNVKDLSVNVKDIQKTNSPLHTHNRSICLDCKTKNKKTILCVCECRGDCVLTREEYLTLFDTVNSFLCDIDKSKIDELNKMVTNKVKGDRLEDIWRPRGPHHIELLIDGFIKHRCLFRDYDDSFEAKLEDYEFAKKFLLEMVSRWDTDLIFGGVEERIVI